MPKVLKNSYIEQTDEYIKAMKIAMTRKDVLQGDLAKRLNKSPSTVSRYLKDPDVVNFGELRAIASYLGLEIVIREKGK